MCELWVCELSMCELRLLPHTPGQPTCRARPLRHRRACLQSPQHWLPLSSPTTTDCSAHKGFCGFVCIKGTVFLNHLTRHLLSCKSSISPEPHIKLYNYSSWYDKGKLTTLIIKEHPDVIKRQQWDKRQRKRKKRDHNC